ncbi:MAG: 2,3,4,5-tetrahydropyridine-2,6-dicarboxylate N-succinyltransferase [Alphaproteobacteria bacterium]|nr:2,3,4,5-tetrahydropyridine-2,6-dicarboxylate N-succinyltransferase [Alphaproteobacteria bacterium]
MTNIDDLKAEIEAGWDKRAELTPSQGGKIGVAVHEALTLLDSGQARVATRDSNGVWTTHDWLKKAALLSFRLSPNVLFREDNVSIAALPNHWDKVFLKTAAWGAGDFENAGFRSVPGAIVRRGSFIGKNVVLMPSFVNIGAYVDEGTMVDTWATVGSCAQIGKNVHISGGAGIGGVLEPLQANPTIIEDGCFIGARSEVAEGVIVREGAVLAMGTFISQSTKIIDRATGEQFRGEVPAYSVVVPGSLPDPKGGPSLACVVIVKRVDAQTRAKTGVNELLRD